MLDSCKGRSLKSFKRACQERSDDGPDEGHSVESFLKGFSFRAKHELLAIHLRRVAPPRMLSPRPKFAVYYECALD